jgi:hypothetical protein
MITAGEVDTLLFDVLGTVVDEAGSVCAEPAAALARRDEVERHCCDARPPSAH